MGVQGFACGTLGVCLHRMSDRSTRSYKENEGWRCQAPPHCACSNGVLRVPSPRGVSRLWSPLLWLPHLGRWVSGGVGGALGCPPFDWLTLKPIAQIAFLLAEVLSAQKIPLSFLGLLMTGRLLTFTLGFRAYLRVWVSSFRFGFYGHACCEHLCTRFRNVF